MNWVHVLQDEDWWWSFMKLIINIQVEIKDLWAEHMDPTSGPRMRLVLQIRTLLMLRLLLLLSFV
jgi:hypothetical protein